MTYILEWILISLDNRTFPPQQRSYLVQKEGKYYADFKIPWYNTSTQLEKQNQAHLLKLETQTHWRIILATQSEASLVGSKVSVFLYDTLSRVATGLAINRFHMRDVLLNVSNRFRFMQSLLNQKARRPNPWNAEIRPIVILTKAMNTTQWLRKQSD
jgi:hypothetical protein